MFALLLTVLCVAICSWGLLSPFLKSATNKEDCRLNGEIAELEIERNIIFTALEDLEQDFNSGKMLVNDYQQIKSSLTRDIGRCKAKIDLVKRDHAAVGS